MILEFFARVKESIDTKHLHSPVGNSIKLEENKKGAICREVFLNTSKLDAPPIAIIIDYEEKGKGVDVHPLLFGSKDNPGLKARCDYALICPYEGKIYVLIVELKSNNPGSWRKQTIAGECLSHYVLSTIDRLNGTNYRASLEYRHVLFTSNTQLRHRGLTGNKPLKYKYDKSRGLYYTIQGCNNTPSTGFPLKNFLVVAKPSVAA